MHVGISQRCGPSLELVLLPRVYRLTIFILDDNPNDMVSIGE